MSTQTNFFDMREVFDELKNFAKSQTSDLMSRRGANQPEPETIEIAVLATLSSGAKNAQQITEGILLASGGSLALSIGKVRGAVLNLVEAEQISVKTKDDRKVYKITDAGKTRLSEATKKAKATAEKASEKSASTIGMPFSFDSNLAITAYKLSPVLLDIAQTGTKAQREKAVAILNETRHQLHSLLADV